MTERGDSAGVRPTLLEPRSSDETPRATATFRSIALPSEHGGWSLTAEPALLGLLVAWSRPGLALGVAALLAFMARTPLKLVLVDRWRHRWLDRTRLAARIATVEIMVFGALVAYAATGGASFWLPLAIAAPLVAVELWFDMHSRGRRLLPELAGAIGIGSVASAIALADGFADPSAWGLWLVVAARVVATIPFVRTQILRGHGRAARLWHSDVAQGIAVVAATGGALASWLPPAAAVVIGLLAVFNVVAARFPPRPAMIIGVQQTFVGIALVVTTAIATAG